MVTIKQNQLGEGAATPRLSLQPLPTAYDPAADQVTVATPSCCCCCSSCCLASMASAGTFFVATTSHRAVEAGRDGRRAIVIATTTLVAVIVSFFVFRLVIVPLLRLLVTLLERYDPETVSNVVAVLALGLLAAWLVGSVLAVHRVLDRWLVPGKLAWRILAVTAVVWVIVLIPEFALFFALMISILADPPPDIGARFWKIEAILASAASVVTWLLVRRFTRRLRERLARQPPPPTANARNDRPKTDTEDT